MLALPGSACRELTAHALFFGAFSARIGQNQRVAFAHARSARFLHNLVMSFGKKKSCSGRLGRQLRSTHANLGGPLCNVADQFFRRTHTEGVGEGAWATQYLLVGRNVKQIRQEKGLTQGRFAELSGFSQQYAW
jgi:hypothetical protein